MGDKRMIEPHEHKIDVISVLPHMTLDGLYRERIQRSANKVAYQHYDNEKNRWQDITWAEIDEQVCRWRAAFAAESLKAGDRVAVMMRNCCEWVIFEQAALSLGLVTVPLYPNDRADNAAYILKDAGVKLLLIESNEQWIEIHEAVSSCDELLSIVILNEVVSNEGDDRLIHINSWLTDHSVSYVHDNKRDDLATIVYTSGTTGASKGVMLSHYNILWNSWSGMKSIAVYEDDLFLSFLPLSHALERTIGMYLPMMSGAIVAYARSIPELAEDLLSIKPTIMISVPRIFERVYAKISAQLDSKPALARKLFNLTIDVGWHRFQFQQRRRSWHLKLLLWPLLNKIIASKVINKLGGNMRFAICGGAPLAPQVAHVFISLGLQIEQGYGLTETSPVLSVNKLIDNDPSSVGIPLEDVELKLGENAELLAKSPGIMMGYWKNKVATDEMIDKNGWLHTGDIAEMHDGHIYITGRLKDILVLSNGEKVPPEEMEAALMDDDLIDQALVLGEGKPYLSALLVLNPERWQILVKRITGKADSDNALTNEQINNEVLKKIASDLHNFPGYAQVRRISMTLQEWNIENGMMTPTLKFRRNRIMKRHKEDIDRLYKGH